MKKLKCIIAGHNSNGDPDLYFVKVEGTPKQFEEGSHYRAAKRAAEDNGYEPGVAFDEEDTAGKRLLPLFDWSTASTVSCSCASMAPVAEPRVCLSCQADLNAPNSVTRRYDDKDEGKSVSCAGHYDPAQGHFEPEANVSLAGGRFDLSADSDSCSRCEAPL